MDIQNPAVLKRIASFIVRRRSLSKEKCMVPFVSAVILLICPGVFYNDDIPYIMQLTQRMLEYRTETGQTSDEFHAKVNMIPEHLTGSTCAERCDSLMKFYTAL